jgi:hypothetical protein
MVFFEEVSLAEKTFSVVKDLFGEFFGVLLYQIVFKGFVFDFVIDFLDAPIQVHQFIPF